MCLGCVDYDLTIGPVTWLPVVSKVRKPPPHQFSAIVGCWSLISKRYPLFVHHQTYWTVKMDGLCADGMEAPTKLTAVSSKCSSVACASHSRLMPLSFSSLSQAIDTGTSLIYVPPALASAFYSLIPGSKRASQYGPGKQTLICCIC